MQIRLINIDSLSLKDKFYLNVENITGRLIGGYKTRKIEIAKIENAIANSNHLEIICGDFNAVPYSFVYQKLKRKYHNAFEKKEMVLDLPTAISLGLLELIISFLIKN
jgi:hypothetical protein